jgi:hypothetical protein
MNNPKISMTKIVKYIRELSIIITGIVITVGFGLWVNKNNIKKDQKQYLDAIILELKENAENFDSYAKKLQKCVRYSNYIISHDEKSINQDSIQYYAYGGRDDIGWGNWNPVTLYNEDAFEMFKSSGAMRQIADKELLLSLWKVYHLMKSTQNEIDDLLQYKKELGMSMLQRTDDGKQVVVPLKWFYINEAPRFMVNYCENTAEFIRETILKLESSEIVCM